MIHPLMLALIHLAMVGVVHTLMLHMAELFITARSTCGIRKNRHNLHHARHHVVEKVTVERPVTHMVGRDIKRDFLCWFYVHRMLARTMIAAAIHQIEEHAVQVDRVGHHGVVDERHADALTLSHLDRLANVGETHPVEGPHIAFHVGRQMDLDLTVRLARILIRLKASEHLIIEGPVRHILQPEARLVQPIKRHGIDVYNAGTDLQIRALDRPIARLLWC